MNGIERVYLVAISSLLLLLSSCTYLPFEDMHLVNDAEPKVDTAAAWQSGNTSALAVEAGWLDQFNVPTLSSFVDEVLLGNPDLVATAHRMEAAGYDINVVDANRQPSLDLGLGADRLHSGGPSATRNNLSFELNSRWEIDVWHRLADESSAAQADFDSIQYDLEYAYLSLAAQAAQSWFSVAEAIAQVALAERTVESFSQTARTVENRFKRGLVKGIDLRQTLTELEDAKATLADRQVQELIAKRQLEILAGRYPSGTMLVATELPEVINEVPAGIPMNLLERRPDLLSAKSKLLSSAYSAQAAEKALLPSFALTAVSSQSSESLTDLLRFDQVFWNLISNMTQPIYQGGRLKYKAKSSRSSFEAQKQVYALALLTAFQEVENALSTDNALKVQLEHTQISAEHAQAAEVVAMDEYGRGLKQISDLLLVQRRNLAQQTKLLQIKRQRINNRIALHLALGGDFKTLETNEL